MCMSVGVVVWRLQAMAAGPFRLSWLGPCLSVSAC